MMRLLHVKMLLHWPSRMHIYGFIENYTFLEQFVSMGVRDHFLYFDNDSLGPLNAYLCLRWPFLPYGGTHNEAPKCKSAASLAL